jgi:hypothetical protein
LHLRKQKRLRGPQVIDGGTQSQKLESGVVQTATSFDYIYYMLTLDVDDSECIHAPKCIAATIADRTSSVPEVPGTHGAATNRPSVAGATR